jgi:uncharacterized membrane protein
MDMIYSVKRWNNLGFRILIFLATFFLIIPGQLQIYGMTIKWALICITILFMLAVLRIFKQGSLDRIFGKFAIYLIFLSLIFLAVSFANNFKDLTINKDLLIAVAMFFACYQMVIFYEHIYKHDYIDATIKNIIVVGLINAIVMLVVYLFPSIGDTLYSYIVLSEKGALSIETSVRRTSGLFYHGFSSLSLFYSILLVMSFVYFSNKKNYSIIYSTLTVIILSLGILLSGRSGLVLTLINVIYLLFFNTYLSRIVSPRHLTAITFFYATTIVLSLFLIDFSQYEDTIRWAFELLFNASASGEFSTSSTDTLFGRMLFLPDDNFEFLFGTGNFGRSDDLPYIRSDSGYVRYIFGFGLLGLIVAFSFHLYILKLAIFDKMSDPRIRFLLLVVVLTILAGNIKDGYYLAHGGYGQILFLLLSLYIRDKTHKSHH